MICGVYALVDEGKAFYIGSSANPPRRLREHRTRFPGNWEMIILLVVYGRQQAYDIERCLIRGATGLINKAPKFNRTEYQRIYMRNQRLKLKQLKGETK